MKKYTFVNTGTVYCRQIEKEEGKKKVGPQGKKKCPKGGLDAQKGVKIPFWAILGRTKISGKGPKSLTKTLFFSIFPETFPSDPQAPGFRVLPKNFVFQNWWTW